MINERRRLLLRATDEASRVDSTRGRKMSRYTLRANMEEAPRTDESAEDMVAADTAPSPQNDMYAGVRYCRTMGRIMRACSSVSGTSPLVANAV